jgi:multidrug efflux pump subunit AcrB
MWIVRTALNRPYTFIVLALLVIIASPVVILRTPTDIFPNINIPVIAVAWTYTGLNPEEMEGRITTVYERVLTTTVDNIEHIESTTINGTAIVKIYLQPTASLDRANAQVTAISQTILQKLPSGTLPPIILNYNASTVPVLQLGLSGNNLTEPQLNDIAMNFLRSQLVTVPGASVPYPFGGKLRQVVVNLNQGLLQSKGLSPNDVLTAIENQNLILPGGTAKIGQFEYDVAALRILEGEAQQQREATSSAQESLQLFTNRYEGGVDNYLQVITAQTVLLTNQRNDTDIERRRMVASVLLVKAVGGGWDVSQLPRF